MSRYYVTTDALLQHTKETTSKGVLALQAVSFILFAIYRRRSISLSGWHCARLQVWLLLRYNVLAHIELRL